MALIQNSKPATNKLGDLNKDHIRELFVQLLRMSLVEKKRNKFCKRPRYLHQLKISQL
jgi:hypothetical protein